MRNFTQLIDSVKITRFTKIPLYNLTYFENTVKYTGKILYLIIEFYIVIKTNTTRLQRSYYLKILKGAIRKA